MPRFKRPDVILAVALASACSSNGTPTTPPPPPPPASTFSLTLTGQVTDSLTSAPIAGAFVYIPSIASKGTTTDSSGHYSFNGLQPGDLGYVNRGRFLVVASADNYEWDERWVPIPVTPQDAAQNVHLYRIIRITAGESTSLTVAPDDALCVNDIQDFPGLGQDYVCRTVRIVAPTDGIMTVEALPNQGGMRPTLEVQTVPLSSSEHLGNPSSIPVTAGTEVWAYVEIVAGSPTSQSFTLTTSLARP